MSRALFVSDIHISSEDDPKYRLFLKFLDQCLKVKTEHLFLVGDIFDLWIADRPYFLKRYSQAILKIKALIESGTTVHYFEGNHDLDLRQFWQKQIGAKVYEKAHYFELFGYRVRVEHGDQMDLEDRGYLFLRWLLRTRLLRWLGRHLPNGLVKQLGERASRASRGYTSSIKSVSDNESRIKIRQHAERSLAKDQAFDILVTGHVHVREDSKLESGQRVINLGTWLKEPLVLMLTAQGPMLMGVTGPFAQSHTKH